MTMERWRVGSLTMGLVLILFGGVTLVSLFAGFSAVNILLTIWPVILICLGIEILLHLFLRKKEAEDVKLKYDVLGILFIGFLLLLSSLFYAFTYAAELYGSREALAGKLGIRSETVYAEYHHDLDGANELTVFGDFYGELTVIQATGSVISVEYDISLRTSDKDYAESLLGGLIDFETGANAYMFYNHNRAYNDARLDWPRIRCIIHLPPGKTLDVSQFRGGVTYDSSIVEQIVFEGELSS